MSIHPIKKRDDRNPPTSLSRGDCDIRIDLLVGEYAEHRSRVAFGRVHVLESLDAWEQSGQRFKVDGFVFLDGVLNFGWERLRVGDCRVHFGFWPLQTGRCLYDVAVVGPKNRDGLPDRQARSLDVGLASRCGIPELDKGEIRPPDGFTQEVCSDLAWGSTGASSNLLKFIDLARGDPEADDGGGCHGVIPFKN